MSNMKPARKRSLGSTIGRHTKCKLSNGEAFFVRYAQNQVPLRDIARHLGVTVQTICAIKRGAVYRDAVLKTRGDNAAFDRLCRIFNVPRWH